jgi:hypothetical protein
VLHSADILADALRVTLGPKMHTIAKEIELKVAVENVAAQIMRKRPERTGAAIGDGTTTAALLAHALLGGDPQYRRGRQCDRPEERLQLRPACDVEHKKYPCVLAEEHTGRLSIQRPALSLFGVRT